MGNNRVVIPKLQYVYIHTMHNSHVGNKHPVKRPLSDFFTKYTSIFTRPFYLIISSAMEKSRFAAFVAFAPTFIVKLIVTFNAKVNL